MEKYSYSKLSTFESCPYRFKFQYIDLLRSKESSISLDMGTTAHKGEELRANYLIKNEIPDYEEILDIVMNGKEYWEVLNINGVEIENNLKENILGFKEIKNKYFEDYMRKCSKSGLTYDDKVKIYLDNLLKKDGTDSKWKTLEAEKHFEFVYNDRCILHGFIDRIDINSQSDIRVIDYKSSKAVYDDKKLTTALQFMVYALACEKIYGKLPIEYIYDFIFIDKQQLAMTKGYYKRGIKKLNNILDKIDKCIEKQEYEPKPSPLCHYCPYSGNTCSKDKELNGLCQYYCLWTPTNKVFTVNKKWKGFSDLDKKSEKKKEFIW